MSQGTKKATSLEKLTAALTEAGWSFESTEKPVKVPDYDKAEYNSWSSRASYVPLKEVPGVVIEATNGIEPSYDSGYRSFTAEFTAEGKYLGVSGKYPFNSTNYPLKSVLEQVERMSAKAIAEREQEREQSKAQQQAEYDAKVAAAYAEAKEALTFAKATTIQNLVRDQGLTGVQAEQVVESIISGGFGPLLNAATQVDRTGKGWLPGESYAPATYVDGKRVEGSEF